MMYVVVGEADAKAVEQSLEYDERQVLYGEEISLSELGELLGNVGLFGEKKLFVIRDLLPVSGAVDWLIEQMDVLESSGHMLVLREEKVLAPVKKRLTKHKITIVEEKSSPKRGGADIQVFAITDAMLRRDRKGAWVAYQEALRSGKSPESILGALWWQMKIVWLSAVEEKPKGVKPFVLGKAKAAHKKYNPREIRALSRSIVSLYHTSRQGDLPIAPAVEKLLLNL